MKKFLLMKRLLLIIAFSLFFYPVKSQPQLLDSAQLIVKYKVLSLTNLLTPEKLSISDRYLYIGKSWTQYFNLSYLEYRKERLENIDKYRTVEKDASGHIIRVIQNQKLSVPGGDREYLFVNKKSNDFTYVIWILFKGYYSYDEKFIRPEWKLEPEQKEILGYSCNKAVASYKGRIWTVWFTGEIPIDSGPWLLSGLPGLILEASDTEGHYSFSAMSIEKATTLLPIMTIDPLQITKTNRVTIVKLLKKLWEEGDASFAGVSIISPTSPAVPKRKINLIER